MAAQDQYRQRSTSMHNPGSRGQEVTRSIWILSEMMRESKKVKVVWDFQIGTDRMEVAN